MPLEALQRPPIDQAAYAERAKNLGYEREPRERQRVFVTGFSQRSPLGATFETSEGLFEGQSGVQAFDVQNWRTNVAGPLPDDYNPYDLLHPNDQKENKGTTKLQAMTIEAAREAVRMAGLLDEESGLIPSPPHNPDRIATWIASGIADTPFISVDVYNIIHNSPSYLKDEKGKTIKDRNDSPIVNGVLPHRESSSKIFPSKTLPVFPEELNAIVAVSLGASGWGGNSYHACAGGSSAIAEGARLIQDGYADIVIAGGAEEALGTDPHAIRPKLTIGEFAASRASTGWVGDPSQASRPFDKDRDGFVPSSGAGFFVLESEKSIRARNGKAYAELAGFANAIDGKNRKSKKQLMTELNPEQVAKTILKAISPQKEVLPIDVAFVHATSTEVGDKLEAEALVNVFGEDLRYIPLSALKSMIGHLLGAAGAVNAVNMVVAMQESKVPHIVNLDNPDPDIVKLGPFEFVRGNNLHMPINRGLAVAYGFGGYDSALLFQKPPEDLAVSNEAYMNYKNSMIPQIV